MKVNKKKLQEALEIVKPGVSNNENIEQATSFAFIKGKVLTYNDSISISHPLEGIEFEGAVVADKLYALLGKIKKDDVDISIEGNELLITSGRSKAGLTLSSEIKLPQQELGEKWCSLPDHFNKHIKFAMSSCGKDMSRPILTCVHITKEGVVESSDGYRLSRCEIGSKMPVKSFLLPATSANEVSKLNPIMISEGNGWVHFETKEGTVISCRIFDGKYPDISKVILMENELQITLPKTTQEVLDRANVFAKRSSMLEETVTITLEDNKLKMRANADGGEGWFEETINLKYDGKSIVFNITPYLLKGILSETQECSLGSNKLKFIGEGWIYLTMLKG